MAEAGSFAERVKQQADIVRVIGEYVRLKKTGQNFTGLCPFHQEKTPSFSVHPVKQMYYCFGCHKGGDIFDFVMEVDRCEFPEAVRTVAEKSGIPIPRPRERSPEERRENQQRTGLVEMHREASAFFARQLHEGHEGGVAMAYLEDRGLNREAILRFGLGFAPSSGDALLRHLKSKYPEKLLEPSGLFSRDQSGRLYDRFRRRIIFPISNESAKVIAFGGRAMGDDMPKYLNSPETPIYSKSNVLYHLDRAKESLRQNDFGILVEGYMDAIAVARAGFANVVASCGTSLAEPQIKLLSRFTRRVVVNYDPDTAGQTATERSLTLLLEKEFEVRVLSLPGGADPDKFLKEQGAEAYRKLLSQAPPYLDYLIGRARKMDRTTAEGKLAAINFLMPYVQRLPNRLLRSEWATRIASELRVDEPVLREALRRAANDRRSEVKPKAELLAPVIKSAERQLMRMLIEAQGFREKLAHEMAAGDLHHGLETERIFELLIARVGDAPDPAALATSLEDRDRRLLFEVLFDPDPPPEPTWEAAESCLEFLRKQQAAGELAELGRKIQSQPSKDELVLRLRRQQELLGRRQGLGTPSLFLNFVNKIGTQDSLTESGLTLGNCGGRAFNAHFEVQDHAGFTLLLELQTATVGEGESYQVGVKCCERKEGRLNPVGGIPSEQIQILFERISRSGEDETFPITIRCDDSYKNSVHCCFVLRRDDLTERIWCELSQAASADGK
jgi:DNA primase